MSKSSKASPASGPALEGVNVCMLRESDYANDGRARKQAAALTAAGARVTMIGVGTAAPADLVESPYDLHIVPRHGPLEQPRLGREDVWWPVRVAVNLTYTRLRSHEHRRRSRWASLVYTYEDELYESASAAKPDVIHAFNIRTLPAAMRAKQTTGARVVYDCRDLYADVDYYDEATKQKFSAAEAELIGDVDEIITVCEPRADVLESRYGISRPTVVYNGPSEVMGSTQPVHDPIRFFFQGAFNRDRNLAALIEAMDALRGRATLTLQGFRGVEPELHEQVEALGLEQVVSFIPPAAPLEVVESAAAYDVGVICHRGDTLNLRSTVPNKLMDYLGAGLALAVSDLEGHRSVLEGTGAALFIDPTSAETIAEDLGRLVDEPERITGMKRAALATAKRYEWSVQAEKLIKVYSAALRSERGLDE